MFFMLQAETQTMIQANTQVLADFEMWVSRRRKKDQLGEH